MYRRVKDFLDLTRMAYDDEFSCGKRCNKKKQVRSVEIASSRIEEMSFKSSVLLQFSSFLKVCPRHTFCGIFLSIAQLIIKII